MQRFPSVTIPRLARGLLLAGAVAALYLLWFWREQSRPGMRHYLKGMEYLTARYPLQAEREWLLGVQQDPAEYHCYEQLGDYYTEVRQPQKAAECYAAAAKRAAVSAPGSGGTEDRTARRSPGGRAARR